MPKDRLTSKPPQWVTRMNDRTAFFNMALRTLAPAFALLAALACGGGGGGSSATSVAAAGTATYYHIRLRQSAANAPSVSGGVYTASADGSGLITSLDQNRIVQGGAQANATGTPEFLLLIRYSTPSFSALSGTYHTVVYGQYGGKTTVGQYTLAISSSGNNTPEVTQYGQSNDHSRAMLSQLPSAQAVTVAADGRVTWGAWTGAMDASGQAMLLHRDQLFLLAGRKTSHDVSEVSGKSIPSITIMQYADDAGAISVNSGTLTSSFDATNYQFKDMSLCQTNQSITVTSASRPFRLRPEDSSLLQLSSATTFADTTEQGFLTGAGFHVIVNPDNPNRPLLMVLLP